MKTKLIDLGANIGKLEYWEIAAFQPEKLKRDAIKLMLICPPTTVETDCGISQIPAEFIEVYGLDNLWKLSNEIREFCKIYEKEADIDNAKPTS